MFTVSRKRDSDWQKLQSDVHCQKQMWTSSRHLNEPHNHLWHRFITWSLLSSKQGYKVSSASILGTCSAWYTLTSLQNSNGNSRSVCSHAWSTTQTAHCWRCNRGKKTRWLQRAGSTPPKRNSNVPDELSFNISFVRRYVTYGEQIALRIMSSSVSTLELQLVNQAGCINRYLLIDLLQHLHQWLSCLQQAT